MPPLVSILIPAYNCERWLADSVASALAQTYAHTEVIIVDDGSKDNTLAVARRFEGPAVRVATQPNAGAAAARNKAFSLAQGDYIQWLDADDLLGRDKVRLQMEAAGVHGPRALYSCGWGFFRHRPWKAQFIATPLWESQAPIEWLTRKWEHNAHMQTATWLTSRQLAEEAGPWDTQLLNDDDGEYFFRVINRCDKIEFVEGAKVYYRIVQGSRLSFIGKDNRKKDAQCLGMERQVAALRRIEDSERVRRAALNYLNTWLHNFYPERPDLVNRLELVAQSLGGTLQIPRLAWKYRWIQKFCGWHAAKSVKFSYNQLKGRALDRWDRTLAARAPLAPSPLQD